MMYLKVRNKKQKKLNKIEQRKSKWYTDKKKSNGNIREDDREQKRKKNILLVLAFSKVKKK